MFLSVGLEYIDLMMNNRLYLVKLGGSLITDKSKPYTSRINIIKQLADEIKRGMLRENKLIIGHGGGSFPHISASKYKTHLGFIDDKSREGMAIVHLDAIKLNIIITEELIKKRLSVFPIHPSSISLAENSEIKKMFVDSIKTLLEYDVIPVVYGDVGIDLDKGCCILSTEEIFRFLALEFKKYYKPFIVMCELVDGVYTEDPLKNPDAELIPEISKYNINEVRKYLSSSYGVDVTGGMKHKVERLYELAQHGINSIITSCVEKGKLEKILKGEKVDGTFVRR